MADSAAPKFIWPCLNYADARAGMRFLVDVLGSGPRVGWGKAVYARAAAGGAEITREMADADYGSRGFTVRDPEGNLFSFGTYRGE